MNKASRLRQRSVRLEPSSGPKPVGGFAIAVVLLQCPRESSVAVATFRCFVRCRRSCQDCKIAVGSSWRQPVISDRPSRVDCWHFQLDDVTGRQIHGAEWCSRQGHSSLGHTIAAPWSNELSHFFTMTSVCLQVCMKKALLRPICFRSPVSLCFAPFQLRTSCSLFTTPSMLPRAHTICRWPIMMAARLCKTLTTCGPQAENIHQDEPYSRKSRSAKYTPYNTCCPSRSRPFYTSR